MMYTINITVKKFKADVNECDVSACFPHQRCSLFAGVRHNGPDIQIILRMHQRNADKNKLCGRPPQYAPTPCKLTFDLLTTKVVSESRVTWATSVPILVFLGSLFST